MKKKKPLVMDDQKTITLPHSSYQPTTAELEEEFHFDCAPDELVRRLLQPVKINRKNPRKRR